MRFNWDAFRGYWDFDYHLNTVSRPYSGLSQLSIPQREATVTGMIERHVLDCQEDVDILKSWFVAGRRLVSCPVFYSTSVLAGEAKTQLIFTDAGKLVIQFMYQGTAKNVYFSSFYLDQPDPFNQVLPVGFDVLQPLTFKLMIAPKERGYTIQRKGGLWHVEPIEFVVIPWVGYRRDYNDGSGGVD